MLDWQRAEYGVERANGEQEMERSSSCGGSGIIHSISDCCIKYIPSLILEYGYYIVCRYLMLY